MMFWILYLVIVYFCFIICFFRVFFSCSNWEQFLCIFFFFCLTFSVTVNLGETFTSCGLKGVFWCGSILIQTACAQCLHSSRGWGWSWVWGRPRPCPVAGTLLGQDLIQVAGGKGQAGLAPFPVGVCSPLSLHWKRCPRAGKYWP